jgi:hypothetical protein
LIKNEEIIDSGVNDPKVKGRPIVKQVYGAWRRTRPRLLTSSMSRSRKGQGHGSVLIRQAAKNLPELEWAGSAGRSII